MGVTPVEAEFSRSKPLRDLCSGFCTANALLVFHHCQSTEAAFIKQTSITACWILFVEFHFCFYYCRDYLTVYNKALSNKNAYDCMNTVCIYVNWIVTINIFPVQRMDKQNGTNFSHYGIFNAVVKVLLQIIQTLAKCNFQRIDFLFRIEWQAMKNLVKLHFSTWPDMFVCCMCEPFKQLWTVAFTHQWFWWNSDGSSKQGCQIHVG